MIIRQIASQMLLFQKQEATETYFLSLTLSREKSGGLIEPKKVNIVKPKEVPLTSHFGCH